MAGSVEAAFGRVIAAVRRAKGLTQDDFSDATNRQYLSEIERGLKSPTLSTIVRLAEVLNVPPAALVAAATEHDFAAALDDEELKSEAAGALLTQALELAKTTLDGLAESQRAAERGANAVLPAAAGIVDIDRFLADAAMKAFRQKAGVAVREERDSLKYIVARNRAPRDLAFSTDPEVEFSLSPDTVRDAIISANCTVALLHDMAQANGVPLFRLLGLRNLSSFVGEICATELCKLERKRLLPNPNQDGYPDLLAMTPTGVKYINERRENGQMSDKSFWSPYPYGGVEVKATCGNTPPASKVAKPQIGESRIPLLETAEWKAHHRKTNCLLGLYWDFVASLPTILAAFYRNDLTIDDWGKIVQPQEEGGRTTSVSIMVHGTANERRGVRKMGLGWIVLPDREALLDAICRVFSTPDPRNDART